MVRSSRKDCVKHAGQGNAAYRFGLDQTMSELPDNQSGKGRHKCAYCAYESGIRRGRADALNEIANHVQERLTRIETASQRS